MAKKVGINAWVGANIKEFSTKMQNVRRTAKKVQSHLTIAFAAGGAVAIKALSAYDKQVQAIAQVEAGLRSTGNAVGRTSAELQKMAAELQRNSIFGDEQILQDVTAQLLTFTNIAGEQFGRTQQAVIDLSARMGTDLHSASIQLGKALNDPVKNLSALSRAGIQFSDEQTKVIKALVETNKHAEAQNIILQELERQFGGSAKAAADAGMGGFKQLQNSLGDLLEVVGKFLSPSANSIADWLQKQVDAAQSAINAIGMFGKTSTELVDLQKEMADLKSMNAFEYITEGKSGRIKRALRILEIEERISELLKEQERVTQRGGASWWARLERERKKAADNATTPTGTGAPARKAARGGLIGEMQGIGIQSLGLPTIETIETTIPNALDKMKESFTTNMQEMARAGSDFMKALDEIALAAEDALHSVAVDGFMLLADSMANFGQSGEKFGEQFMNMVAGVAKQLARMVIGMGVALLPVSPGQGLALIAGGTALAAIAGAATSQRGGAAAQTTNVEVQGAISGGDIVLVSDRYRRRRK